LIELVTKAVTHWTKRVLWRPGYQDSHGTSDFRLPLPFMPCSLGNSG